MTERTTRKHAHLSTGFLQTVTGSSQTWILSVSLLLAVCGATAVAATEEPMLPVLDWKPRADWINVKTDVTPAALGDGKADDSTALQQAINKAGGNGTIYLPAGTYRITQTLHSLRTGRSVDSLIGHGRDTRILWDGPAGKPMFVSHGQHRSWFTGIIFDGQKKAGAGVSFWGDTGFQTRLRFRHMGFVNLQYGVQSNNAESRGQAAAETVYENCLFMNCSETGAYFDAHNYYNHQFTGCEFRNNGTGIRFFYGQGNVWDSHFQNNGTDVFASGEHGISLRRCTSQDSGRFVIQNRVDPMTIQDCAVSGWREAGAIQIDEGGWKAPTLIFDCTFSNPATNGSPAIKLTDNSPRTWVVLSNNRTSEGVPLITGGKGEEWHVPPGAIDRSITSSSRTFLKSKVAMPGVSPDQLFDVKSGFGAVGDGKTDDTQAIRRAIEAARAHGRGALAYLPTGNYRITAPIEITGSNYVVGGTLSSHTRILWDGPTNASAVVRVHDTHNVSLQHVAIGAKNQQPWMSQVAAVRQVGTDKPTTMHYDDVQVPGLYWEQEIRPVGFMLDGLAPKDLVDIDMLDGETRIVDSARANILIDYHYEGVIHISDNKSKTRDGFLGIQFKLQTHNFGYALRVQDNLSVVMSDFYIENTDKFFSLSGQPGNPPGRVTIQGAKLHCRYKPGDPTVIKIDNYEGLFSLGPQGFKGFYTWVPPKVHPRIQQTGDRAVDVIVMGTMCYPFIETAVPEIEMGQGARLTMIANPWHDPVVPDAVQLKPISLALDHLRELGAWDLRVNHSN